MSVHAGRYQRLKTNEIEYTIQGESTFAGRPCVLVRLTGCQMRCRWCDTAYAFYEGEWMTREEVLDRVAALGCGLVEVTGGEPLLQPAPAPQPPAFPPIPDCRRGWALPFPYGRMPERGRSLTPEPEV